MSLQDTITDDLKKAMKAKDKIALIAIRALKTAVKNAAIEKGGADATLSDAEIIGVIRKQVKQRQDSISQYTENNRLELAESEQNEVLILEKYLPTPLSAQQLEALVSEVITETGATSRSDMGKVIGIVQSKADGKADGKSISQAVMQQLS